MSWIYEACWAAVWLVTVIGFVRTALSAVGY